MIADNMNCRLQMGDEKEKNQAFKGVMLVDRKKEIQFDSVEHARLMNVLTFDCAEGIKNNAKDLCISL